MRLFQSRASSELIGNLMKPDRQEWVYSGLNDTWYTDLNETLTEANIAVTVIRNLDSELVPPMNEVLAKHPPRTQKVNEIYRLLRGYPVSELVIASNKATDEVELFPDVKKTLPKLYPTKICIFTGSPQISAETYVAKKICPLYYKNVPDEMRGSRISVTGTLLEEENGILTGRVLGVPDDSDRSFMALRDLFESLGTEVESHKPDGVITYPFSGLKFKF